MADPAGSGRAASLAALEPYKFKPGQSGNPTGMSAGEYDKLTKVRMAAQRRSLKAIRTLEAWMQGEDGKVAVAASVAILKVAGVFNDEAAIERKVEERLKQLIGEAQSLGPLRLASVGG